MPEGGWCAELAGSRWSLQPGDALSFEGRRVVRTASRGVWQPAEGRCTSAGRWFGLTFGEEQWRVVPLLSCALVLHGPLHQRRELLPVHGRSCPDEELFSLQGTRWELPGGRALVLDLDGRATDLDLRFGWWSEQGGAAIVRWSDATWLLAQQQACTAIVRTPHGDVEAVRRFPPCAVEEGVPPPNPLALERS